MSSGIKLINLIGNMRARKCHARPKELEAQNKDATRMKSTHAHRTLSTKYIDCQFYLVHQREQIYPLSNDSLKNIFRIVATLDY